MNGLNDVQFMSFVGGNFSAPVNNLTDAFSTAVVAKPWDAAMAKTYAVNQSVLGQLVSSSATNTSPYGTTGRFSKYSSGGTIHWSAKAGAVIVTAEMEKIYGQVGGSGTWLGMPTGNQYAWRDGTRQDFEGGYLFRNPSLATALRAHELPVVANDFTGDGKADLLWRNGVTGENQFWQMNGAVQVGKISTDSVGDKNFKIVGIADFDRDGQNDILWSNAITGDNVIWRMNGTKHIGDLRVDKANDLNWQIAGVGDFDKDGRADIVWRHSRTGDNLVWKMDNNVHVADLKIETVLDNNWQIVGVADFTGDQQVDLLWRNSATGDNLIWQMNGVSRTNMYNVGIVSDFNWQVASTADFNGDGKSDILWRNSVNGNNLLWQMDISGRRLGSADVMLSPLADSNWKVAGNGNLYVGDNAIARTEDANRNWIGKLTSIQSTRVSPLGTTGRFATYDSGATIHWSAKAGAVVITSEMEALLKPQGGSSGWLGMPTSNQYNWTGGTRQDFEGGYLFRNSNQAKALRPNELPNVDASLLQATRAVIDDAKLLQKVAQTYQNQLGKALTGLVDQGDGTQKQTFELGYLRTILGSYTAVQFVMRGDLSRPLALSVAPIPPDNLAEIFQKNVRQYASILGNPIRPDIHDVGYRKQMLFANHILVWEGGDKLEIRQVNDITPNWLKEINKKIQLETAIDITPEWLRVASARSNIGDYGKANYAQVGSAIGNLIKQPDGSYGQLYENATISYKDGKTTVTPVNTIVSPFIQQPLPSGGNQDTTKVLGGSIDSVWQIYQGTLGGATSGVQTFSNDVTYQLFQNGSVVKSDRGTFALYGAIRGQWLSQGGLGGWLGVPTSAETGLGDGVIKQSFANGYVIWDGSKTTVYNNSGNLIAPSNNPNPTLPSGPSVGASSSSSKVDDFINRFNGTANITRLDRGDLQGECVSLIARYLGEEYLSVGQKNMSLTLGNGRDTASVVASQFSQFFKPVSDPSDPVRGSIMSFPEIGGGYGHVAIVAEARRLNGQLQVRIIDSNSGQFGRVVREHSTWITISSNFSAPGYGSRIVWTNPKDAVSTSPNKPTPTPTPIQTQTQTQTRPVSYTSLDSATYESFARDVAYTENLGDPRYTIDRRFKDFNTGFSAIALQPKDLGSNLPYVLTILGTNNPSGMIDDMNPFGIGAAQFKNNKADIEDWLSNHQYADIVGHSLGGALAQEFAADFTSTGGKLGNIVTFNSPGVNYSYANQFKAANVKSVEHYIYSSDIVSLGGSTYLPGNSHLISFSDLNIYDKHVVPNTRSLSQNRNITQTGLSTNWLSSPLFHYEDPDYFAFLLAVAALSPELAVSLVTRGTVEASRELIGASSYLIATGFSKAGEFGTKALNATIHWTSDTWDTTTHWTSEAWNAASHWTADAWNASAKWTADTWNATSQWTAVQWNKTLTWTADQWNNTTQWASNLWNGTQNNVSNAWKIIWG